MMGVAFVAPVAQIFPLLVACTSMLAGAALVDVTSQAILIGLAEQFNPETTLRPAGLSHGHRHGGCPHGHRL